MTTEEAADPIRRIRAIIVDDDPMVRRAVRDALQDAGVTVIAEAPDGRQGTELTLHYKPDVVVLDVFMPGLDGLDAMRRIHARLPQTCCIMLSVSSDPELGVVALRSGAAGFLTKGDVSTASLAQILEGALDGEVACSGVLMANVVHELRRLPDDGIGMRPVRSVLTPREWEVLDLMCLGRGTTEIADELVLSGETVRSHIKNLMRKLGARSRAQAVELAVRERGSALVGAEGSAGPPG